MPTADLHIHSNRSNGTMSPEEILEAVHGYNRQATEPITTIAITDHEQVEGALEVQHIAEEMHYEMQVWCGVELRTRVLDTNVDILGYWFDPMHESFNTLLRKVQAKRRERNRAVLDSLCKTEGEEGHEIVLEMEKLDEEARPSCNPDNDHIARLMVKKGYMENERKALELLNHYVIPIERLPSSEIIKGINESGGIAVYAHPGIALESDYRGIAKLLINEGIRGIEVFHPEHRDEVRTELQKFAKDYNLLVFGGSDAHGLDSPIYPKRVGDAVLANGHVKVLDGEYRRRRAQNVSLETFTR